MPGPRGMILPPHERASGEVPGPKSFAVSDVRIPNRIRYDYEPTVLGHHRRTDSCPDGRHLLDVIETAMDVEPDDADAYERFRATMTCVRCGYLEQWDGTRTRTFKRANPEPLAAGHLVAQQVSALDEYRDLTTWVVFSGDVEVGVIGWARGPRGRSFHKGRMHAWPDGQTVEGADPAAVLRKLARGAGAAASATDGGAVGAGAR